MALEKGRLSIITVKKSEGETNLRLLLMKAIYYCQEAALIDVSLRCLFAARNHETDRKDAPAL